LTGINFTGALHFCSTDTHHLHYNHPSPPPAQPALTQTGKTTNLTPEDSPPTGCSSRLKKINHHNIFIEWFVGYNTVIK